MPDKQITVLVVDHDANVRSLLEGLLRAENANPIIVDDGVAAVTMAEKTEIDVAFIDMHISGLESMRVCQKLKTLNPLLVYVFMSEHDFPRDVVVGISLPADAALLRKPFRDLNRLKDTIRSSLERARLYQGRDKKAVSNDKKRAYVRFEGTFNVSYSAQGAVQATPHRSMAEDISLGGMRIVTQEDLFPGTQLLLSLGVPGYDQACEALGEVLWCKPIKVSPVHTAYEVGISFKDVDLSKLTRLLMHCIGINQEAP